jgi:ubiquinone/menaquinone biosynthesis C-methylase UbiE
MGTNERRTRRVVKDWYAKNARNEWRRLGRDPYHQIEFMVTMHFVEKYLPKQGLVLDAGGGPGRYTIELAKRGYDVALLDLAPEMLKVAKRQIKRAGVQKRVKKIVEGSIDDLSMFADESFDAVLCLGAPLSHILDAKRRDKAITELLRVSKKGGPIFVSVISRIGLLRTIIMRFPHEMKYAWHHWTVGDYVPGLQGKGFTATHWFLPETAFFTFCFSDLRLKIHAKIESMPHPFSLKRRAAARCCTIAPHFSEGGIMKSSHLGQK